MPRFSIIIPFHNAAGTLPATLDSLTAQNFTDWEAICINDRATDGSTQIIARYAAKDCRIKRYDNPGSGPSDARNHGARLAQSKYLSFCDADDLWTERRLSDLDAAFRRGAAHALYGRVAFFSGAPGRGTTQSTVLNRSLTISDLLGENHVCTMSNLTVEAAAYRDCGGLDRQMVHNEDLEFLIRFIGTGHRIDGLDKLHVWYRANPTGLSSDLAAMQEGRQTAVACAQRFGVHPTRAQEAIYMRYLARRALRLGRHPADALRFTQNGLAQHAPAFLHPLRRGAVTALAAIAAPILPQTLRHSLFSN